MDFYSLVICFARGMRNLKVRWFNERTVSSLHRGHWIHTADRGCSSFWITDGCLAAYVCCFLFSSWSCPAVSTPCLQFLNSMLNSTLFDERKTYKMIFYLYSSIVPKRWIREINKTQSCISSIEVTGTNWHLFRLYYELNCIT